MECQYLKINVFVFKTKKTYVKYLECFKFFCEVERNDIEIFFVIIVFRRSAFFNYFRGVKKNQEIPRTYTSTNK